MGAFRGAIVCVSLRQHPGYRSVDQETRYSYPIVFSATSLAAYCSDWVAIVKVTNPSYGLSMDKSRTGGAIMVGTGVLGPWIADMIDLKLSTPVGWFLLGVCVVAFVAGLLMVFWPKKADDPPTDLRDTTPLRAMPNDLPQPPAVDPVNARAFELMAIVYGKTDYQAGVLMKPLLGTPLSLRGKLINASGQAAFSSATIALDEDYRRSAFVVFSSTHEGLLTLHIGDTATVRGLIKNITDRGIDLIESELVH